MTIWTGTRTTALGLTLLLCAACGQGEFTGAQSQEMATSEAPAASTSPKAPKPARKARAKPAPDPSLVAKPIVLPDAPPPPKVELPPLAPRGNLLQRLPKSTLFAVRFPHVEKFGEALSRIPLEEAFERPAMKQMRERFESILPDLEADMREQFPDLPELKAQFRSLEGELAFALLSLDAKILSGHAKEVTGCPVTCALMFDAGPHADDVQHLLDRLFASAAADLAAHPQTGLNVEVVADGNESWHRHARIADADFELARDGAQFVLQVGPKSLVPAVASPLPVRALEESFAAAHVVRATRDLSKEGSVPVFEYFVSLDPIWTVLEMFGPAEVKRVLAACGATSIHGMSMVSGLAQTGIDEALFLDAPEGNDLLTRVFAAHPISPSVAKFLPHDAASTALMTFDADALLDGVRKLLPDAEEKKLDAAFDAFDQQGFDVRKDIIANLGPTFAVTGDPESFSQLDEGRAVDSLEMTFIVQLKDGARFRQMLDKVIKISPFSDGVHSREMYGYTTSRLDPMPVPDDHGRIVATFEPSWCVDDHAFILSFTNAGLAHALSAASGSDEGTSPIQSALASDQAGAFSITAMTKETAALTIGRRTSLGLEMVTKGGTGKTGGYVMLAGAAMASAVALPALTSGRAEADEAAAVTTLRSIHTAELQFRAERHDDLDRDGDGEFGTLGELTGTTGLRSLRPALSRPLLPASMRPDENDCFTVSGYVFRIDVARRSPRNVDDDEREFMAYAWPVSGMRGRKAFSIDADGRLWSSDNQGDEQHYSGSRRVPKLDAAKRSLSSRPLVGIRGRLGRDGGTWEHAD